MRGEGRAGCDGQSAAGAGNQSAFRFAGHSQTGLFFHLFIYPFKGGDSLFAFIPAAAHYCVSRKALSTPLAASSFRLVPGIERKLLKSSVLK